jgi:hypothetical protein
VFKNFKGYNWLLLAVGLCYIILAIVDASGKDERDEPFKECDECKESLVHIVIPTKKHKDKRDSVEDDDHDKE